MKKRKVLILVDSMNGGGAERVLAFVLRQIHKEDFDCALYTVVKEGVYLKDVPPNVPIQYLFAGDETLAQTPWRIVNKCYRAIMYRLAFRFTFLLPLLCRIKSGEFDLAVSFCEGYNTILIGQIASRFETCIQWLQVDVSKHEATHNPKAFVESLQVMSVFVAVSQQTLQSFEARYGSAVPNAQRHVVYNPVDVALIQKKMEDACSPFHMFTFIGIGRLQEQKRFDRLIEAHALLRKKGYPIQTVLLGKGALLKPLQELCHKLDVADSVKFEGFRSNVFPWLKQADVFVLSSDYEGFPGVVCEAMTLCKPIVATRITGAVELLENGKWGLIADANPQSLAAAMERMYLDSQLRTQFEVQLKSHQGTFLFKDHISDVSDIIKRYLCS